MKRVLYMDLSPSPGGSIFSLYQLVRHLDPGRYTPVVVLSTINGFRGFDELGIAVERVRTRQWEPSLPSGLVQQVRAGPVGHRMRGSALWRWLGSLRRLYRYTLQAVPPLLGIIRGHNPDLVHLNTGIPLLRAGAIAGRLARVPTICHCRSFLTPSASDNRFLVPGLSGMLCISQAVADVQLATMSNPPPHRVIPNALDIADYQGGAAGSQGEPAVIRRSLGVPDDALLLGMIGRITPWKGQHVFIDALAQVCRRFPLAMGVLVGGVEQADRGEFTRRYPDQLREQVVAAGLQERVRFAGFRADLPEVLQALDVVVHCSVQPEPFGRVIIEGMAAGRPVVASAAGGVLEIITPGEDGLLVPPADASALAEALAYLLENAAERQRLGAAGRRTVAQRYGIDGHVAAVQAFYDEILSERAADGGRTPYIAC